MDVAAAFYTSGTFWAGAGVVVAVLAAVAVVWVTFTVGFPRRRLYYGIRDTAPLLAAPPGMRSNLELRHRRASADSEAGDHADSDVWQILAHPHVLTLGLVSRGRKDIPSDAYNDHEPLRLDVGARIVEVLQTTSKPETLAAPQITADGTSLEIGPGLIGKRHEITVTVLTDGGKPSVTCQSPLIDVEIRQRLNERPTPETTVHTSTLAITFAVALTLAVAAKWPEAVDGVAVALVVAVSVWHGQWLWRSR
jgi:hypothetical protein